MFFPKSSVPLQARKAMGFRGRLGVRSCFKCGRTEENNFDSNGRLRQLRIKSINKNLNDTRASNHYYVCSRCK